MKLRELGISYLFQQNHGDKRNPDVFYPVEKTSYFRLMTTLLSSYLPAP